MNKRQIAGLRRLKAVRAQLDAFSSEWSGIVGITRAADDLDALLSDLEETLRLQKRGSRPSTAYKSDCRRQLIEQIGQANAFLVSFANTQGLPELLMLADRSTSAADLRSAEELVAYAQLIYEEAEKYSDELEEFGYYSSDLVAFGDGIALYREVMNAPRAAINRRHASTKVVQQQLNQATHIFERRLDPQMRSFERSNPKFFNSYWAARSIVDAPVTREEGGADAVAA